jgi:hypothetical protein
VYFHLIINYYICGGKCLSIAYHISRTVFYMVGHHSFRFVKDAFVGLVLMSIERQMFATIEKH